MTARLSTPTAPQLLERTVTTQAGCMEWQGAITARTGYGKVKSNGKAVDVHRALWVAHNGSIPAGQHVCHRCDNRRCIQPAHLFLGTHSENMLDASAKGRLPNNATRGEDSTSAKLTESQVLEIQFLALSGMFTMKAIGDQFGVSRRTVGQIKRSETWRHLLAPEAVTAS